MVRDIHYHIEKLRPIKESVEFFNREMQQNNVEKIVFLSVPVYDECIIQNLMILTAKDMMYPSAFAFCGFWYDKDTTADDLLIQLKNGLEQGFEGLKMIEGKPDMRKKLGFGFDSPMYDKVLDLAEELDLPILIHIADPVHYWDYETLKRTEPYRITDGHYYGAEGFLSLDETYAEFERMMEKHPNLKVILAHFAFMYDKLDMAQRFLDKYPNLSFDLTPGVHMFQVFTENREEMRDFLEKNSERIYLGTDSYNAGHDTLRNFENLYNLVCKNIADTEEFSLPDFYFLPEYVYKPLGLSKKAVENINYNNHKKLLGDTPKPNNKAAIIEEIERLSSRYESFSDDEKKVFDEIKEYYCK